MLKRNGFQGNMTKDELKHSLLSLILLITCTDIYRNDALSRTSIETKSTASTTAAT